MTARLLPLLSLLLAQIIPASTFAQSTISMPNAGNDGLIGDLQITAPTTAGECHSPCSILQTTASSDAIVFFLEHQVNHGLVRLSGDDCRHRTVANIVRHGEVLRFPITSPAAANSDWVETYDWNRVPDRDTFYAVVVASADVARRFANHIDGLPLRCTTSVLPGLSGDELNTWLSEFAMLAARSAKFVDWRAIELRVTLN